MSGMSGFWFKNSSVINTQHDSDTGSLVINLLENWIERVYTLNLFNEYLPHFVLISDSDIEPDLNYNNDNEIW